MSQESLASPAQGTGSPALLPHGMTLLGSSPVIPTSHPKPQGFRDLVRFGAGWLSPPQEHRVSALHLCGGLLHTCTPRPCICITWARRVWIPLRMVFWCSASVIPRLRTSLQNEPRISHEKQAPTVKCPDTNCSKARAAQLSDLPE